MKIFLYHKHVSAHGQGGLNPLEDAMKNLGHEVHVFNSGKKYPSGIPIVYQIKTRRMNLELKKEIVEFQPDVFFTIAGRRIFPEIIEFIKSKGIKTILWAEADIGYFERISQYIAPHYDYVFTNSPLCIPKYKKLGVKNIEYMPFMFYEKAREVKLTDDDIKKYKCEISFAGNYFPIREKILKNLTNFDLQIYGPHWQYANRRIREFWNGLCREVFKLYRCSNICLNIHQHEQVFATITNSRTFEVTGMGEFLLADRTLGIEDLFVVGKEIVCFDNIKDLKEKIRYYLDNPKERRRTSRRGQRRTLNNYTYRILLGKMLKKCDL